MATPSGRPRDPGSVDIAVPPAGRADAVGPEVGHTGAAHERHRPLELGAEDAQHPGDALLAAHGQPVEIGPPDHTGPGAQCERPGHVGAPPNAAVEQDLDLAAYGLHDLG